MVSGSSSEAADCITGRDEFSGEGEDKPTRAGHGERKAVVCARRMLARPLSYTRWPCAGVVIGGALASMNGSSGTQIQHTA